MSHRPRPRAFTLVELLVVITIIVVLLAMLAPVLDRAVQAALLARCLSNQHAIGNSIALYLGDSKRFYPVMNINWGLLGDLETVTFNQGQTTTGDVTSRPLNAYLGYTADGTRVPVAHCPADTGFSFPDDDPTSYVDSLYLSYGNSYYPAYAAVSFEPTGFCGVKLVFGHAGGINPQWGKYAPLFRNPVPSVKQTSLARLDNKLLNADWPWPGNNPTREVINRWHKPEVEDRYFSTLMADGHAELLYMDKHLVELSPGNENKAYFYDPSHPWW